MTDTIRGAPDTLPTVVEPVGRGQPTLIQQGIFGRFTVLSALGSGGMGVVFAAYDPHLDRRVAIKVLKTRGVDDERRQREASRLLREARALAQLSHPHVITVFDAGTIDQRVYIAMEFVEGKTLRAWLTEQKRTTAEILDVYLKAGSGLTAGHAAGVVHRDFKPDNVLVGNDGRVRVIDFGLARPNRPDSRGDADEDELSGTPMYMAPEQQAGAVVDGRADQFAFCVSLFEGLYGRVPFQVQTYVELVAAATAGQIEVPNQPQVPRRVVDAILRGLRADPAQRFPSMEALLAELTPRVRRPRGLEWTVFAAIAAAALTLGIVYAVAPARLPACGGGDERVAGVWDAAVKAKVKAALLASDRSHAGVSYDRVEAALDQYAGEWKDRRKRACEATRVRHERSEVAYELGMRCFDERLEEVRGLTSLFAAGPDVQLADRAVSAVEQLPPLAVCSTASPGAMSPPPTIAPLVAGLQNETAVARAYIDAGKSREAIAKLSTVVPRAHQLAYPPLEAGVQFTAGRAYAIAGQPKEAEAALREAIQLAARAKADGILAESWSVLVSVLGLQQARYADALALEPVAEAAIVRADGGDEMRAALVYYIGTAALQKGDYAKARSAFELSLALREKVLGADHQHIAEAHNSLGATLLRLGDLDGATKHFEKALAMGEKVLGPTHPDFALPLANLGAVAQMQGRLDDASKYFERALKILEEVYGPDHVQVGLTVHNLGELARGRKDCASAVKLYTRALGIFEKQGPTHPYVAYALVGRAQCRADLGAPDAAADAERAVAILASGDPEQLAEAKFALARAVEPTNRARARALSAEARKALVAAGPAGAPVLAELDAWLSAHP